MGLAWAVGRAAVLGALPTGSGGALERGSGRERGLSRVIRPSAFRVCVRAGVVPRLASPGWVSGT